MGDVIDIFRDSTTAFTKKIVESRIQKKTKKNCWMSNSDKYLWKCLIPEKLICQSCLSRLRFFYCPIFNDSTHIMQSLNEQVPVTLSIFKVLFCQT